MSHKKQDTQLLSISSPNIDQFSKSFQRHTQQDICNKTVYYRSDNISDVSLHYLVKYKFFKNCTDQKHSNGRPSVSVKENVNAVDELALSQ